MAWAKFCAAHFALTFTGAAQTWFAVNIPATAAGTSETISARSSFFPFSEPLPVPSRLMSQKTAAARNPSGAQIDPGVPRYFVESLKFPYLEGLKLCVEGYRRGGWKMLDKMDANPPRTTREVLHPGDYFVMTGEPYVVRLASRRSIENRKLD